MFKKLFSGLGDSNEKQLKRLQPIVEQINGLETEIQKLSDDELTMMSSWWGASSFIRVKSPR